MQSNSKSPSGRGKESEAESKDIVSFDKSLQVRFLNSTLKLRRRLITISFFVLVFGGGGRVM